MRSAIIDIGYNAIRAVVYENDKLGAPEIFNSKFKNDMLNLLTNESLDIKHPIYLYLKYFVHVFNNLEVSNIKCVATAVLRNQPRAQELVNFIKEKFNINIEILSGVEEAKLTALGLTKSVKNCNGVAVDLGGGSLELIEIADSQVIQTTSINIGTKTVSSFITKDTNQTELKIANTIKTHFNKKKASNLYMIGGALRFISKSYLDFAKYPIKNLHNLVIQKQDFYNYLCYLQSSPLQKNSRNATYIAKALISIFQPKKITISTYGLKEGVRISIMPPEEQNKDIIYEKIKYTFENKFGPAPKIHIKDHLEVLKVLIPEINKFKQIVEYSLMLSKIKYKFDNNIHTKILYEFILYSEIPFDHKSRIMIAIVLISSLNQKYPVELMKTSKQFLTRAEYSISQVIGYYMYIAEMIDGSIEVPPSFFINAHHNYLELETQEILPRSIFEKICQILKNIASIRKMLFNLNMMD